MASAMLRRIAGTIFSECNLLKPRKLSTPIGWRTLANVSNKSKDYKNEEQYEEPLRFTGSKADTWIAMKSRTGKTSDEPWYQMYVVIASTAAFLIYFGILREESDIDRHFDLTLYDHIEGLEEVQLRTVLKFNRERNLDTKEIEARLREIEKQKMDK
ncbi:uncharacterized protein LOC124181097 isoform X1 [Neodiprion fabricii]|uniref:uncharacterized protein LOC124181097 isoform X1 n=1 Tax=Neodiprion fabricii TaxID=2872261 RepID=UPI001ED976C8|nr:uncharacterized protein LOC124181097 isoform X1 [Neodiprion fabricii]